MSLLLLAVSAGLAGGWEPLSEMQGCRVMRSEAQTGFDTLRLECVWDIAPDRLHAVLSATDDRDEMFSGVKASERLPSGRYRQVYQATGIADREIILEMGQLPIPGGARYWWRKAADQSELSGANLEAAYAAGMWEVTAAGPGQARVVHERHYDPGGAVPSTLERWYQTAGLEALIVDLKNAAASR